MGLSSKQVISSVGDLQDWPNLQPPQPTIATQQPPGNQLQQQLALTPQKRQAMLTEPAPPSLRCPRCDSANTKFCYYNNYSQTQPRYLCKTCRRHWTSGGTLRNVPVGGSRKTKRPRTAAAGGTTKCGISANNNAMSPSSSGIHHQTTTAGTNLLSQHSFPHYSSLMDAPEVDDLNAGSGMGVSGSSVNLAHLLSLPPLSLPFSTAALGSFLDLASGPTGSFTTAPSVSPFFPLFMVQPDAPSSTAALVTTSDPISHNALPPAWHRSSSHGALLLPNIGAEDSSSPNVLSPQPAGGAPAGTCAGMMTAPWIDDFAGLISTYQQPQDYHLL